MYMDLGEVLGLETADKIRYQTGCDLGIIRVEYFYKGEL